MKTLIPIISCLAIGTAAHAGSLEGTCAVESCLPGDKAVTQASDAEPYFACPSRELADYTDIVIGMMAFSIAMTGHLPNISDASGDPEFPDAADGSPNLTMLMLKNSRRLAQVQSFDQAIAMCRKGRTGIRVNIMNNPGKGAAIWVQNNQTKETFWMGASALLKR